MQERSDSASPDDGAGLVEPLQPRIMWLWGYQPEIDCWAIGALWGRVPREEWEPGVSIYAKRFVVAWNPREWQHMKAAAKAVLTTSIKVRK